MAPEQRTFHFHNCFHIGDNLMNLKFFRYLSDILKARNYIIYYYYDKNYKYNKEETLQSYIVPGTVYLKPLHEKPHNSIELWMGIDMNGISHGYCEKYFHEYYKYVLRILEIDDASISTSLWIDESYLLPVYDTLDEKYKNVDILILNSVGQSGQCNDPSPLSHLAKQLSARFKVVTAEVVDDSIACVSHISLQHIAAISTHTKYIIGTASGTQVACLNKQSKESVKKWFFATTGGARYEFYSIDCMYSTNMDITPIKAYFDSI